MIVTTAGHIDRPIHLALDEVAVSNSSEIDDLSLNSQASSSQQSSPTNSSLTCECRANTPDDSCPHARRQSVTVLHGQNEIPFEYEPMGIYNPSSNVLLPSPINDRQQALSLPPALDQSHEPLEKVRRISRSEHRRSLFDLGYGKVESYARLQRLGKGTYATVFLGKSRLSNDLVALKEIHQTHDEGAPCTAIREVSLLRLLRHNNIVTLHDICHTPKKLVFVFEYVGPDLYAYMRENNNLLSMNNIRVSPSRILSDLKTRLQES